MSEGTVVGSDVLRRLGRDGGGEDEGVGVELVHLGDMALGVACRGCLDK